MRFACAAVAFVMLGSAALPQTSTTVLEVVSHTPEIDKSTQTHDVQFKRDANDRMTVAVKLSGAGPYRFLVDTGADRTAISRQLASRLKLPPGKSARLHSISGASVVQTANLPQMELNQKVIRDIEAPMLEATNMGADGILGVDSLRSERVLFDFKKKTMAIVPSTPNAIPFEKDTIVVTGRLKNGRLLMTDAVADTQRLSVVVDTGSQVTIANHALRRKLAGKGMLRRSGTVEIQSVTGQKMTGDYMFLSQLEVGNLTLKDLAIVFADVHTFKQLGLSERPALLLGMNAMRAFDRVSIDFANRKLRVVLPQHSSLDTQRLAAL